MTRRSWAPDYIDLDRPSAARVYDYLLGGSHNFGVDRQFAEDLLSVLPDIPEIARANRAFLRRAVRFLSANGIDQFLDLGSGIPTAGNVHEVARQANPDARVVYVDTDPVAVSHSRALLRGDAGTGVVAADICHPEDILGAPETARLIDFSRPAAVLLVAVLHFVSDVDGPAQAVARLRSVLAPGSYLVISHGTLEGSPAAAQRAHQLYQRSAEQGTSRTREQIAAFFGDFALVPPGLVYLPLWRPEPMAPAEEHPERFCAYAGVGVKP